MALGGPPPPPPPHVLRMAGQLIRIRACSAPAAPSRRRSPRFVVLTTRYEHGTFCVRGMHAIHRIRPGSAADFDWPVEANAFSAPPCKFQRGMAVGCVCSVPRLHFPALQAPASAYICLVLYTPMPALTPPPFDPARSPHPSNPSPSSPSIVSLL